MGEKYPAILLRILLVHWDLSIFCFSIPPCVTIRYVRFPNSWANCDISKREVNSIKSSPMKITETNIQKRIEKFRSTIFKLQMHFGVKFPNANCDDFRIIGSPGSCYPHVVSSPLTPLVSAECPAGMGRSGMPMWKT